MSIRSRESRRSCTISDVLFAAVLGLTVALVVSGCGKKNDPRCAQVAEASKMAGIAAIEERYDGEQRESLIAQLEAQTGKVEQECQEMLANDDSGLWDRWADCMVAATTAEEVKECRNVK